MLGAQNKLNTEQERWLYRIVQKTPALKQNWNNYFAFEKDSLFKAIYRKQENDPDVQCDYLKLYPEKLTIHYDSIQNSSYGLISEAAIKLTLWELNEELKKSIYQPQTSNDSLFNSFCSDLEKHLTKKLNKKKQEKVFTCVMHPSLPIFKKIEELSSYKIDASDQKKLLNGWSDIVSTYSNKHSQYYYGLLSDDEQITSTTFLAAGEGSGTSGLLYEWERNPQDSTKIWYGKGIGLFTYRVRTYKDEVRLNTQTQSFITLPKGKAMALHTSLWGLNSSFKPMLIITDDSVSYHLFSSYATEKLSPDASISEGISHVDRIAEYRERKITNAIQDIQDNELLTKNYARQQLVEDEITKIESEIDTLRKYEPDNLDAINYRKRLIDAKLTNLSNISKRTKELERDALNKNKAIINAEKELQNMIDLLGPSPQQYTQENDMYNYESGVRFNYQTQDLIFPPSDKERELSVLLISAGYTLEGKKKDEVQAYVSVTDANKTMLAINTKPQTLIDTSLFYYFHPDEFRSYSYQTLNDDFISKAQECKHIQFTIGTLTKPDSIKNVSKSYANFNREHQLPLTTKGQLRKVVINVCTKSDTLYIESLASTDPVPTRLSKVPESLKQSLDINSSSTQNNTYLEALRAISTLNTALQTLNLSISNTDIDNLKNLLDINTQSFEKLMEFIETSE